MRERKCVKCGASLTDKDVIRAEFEDGSCKVIPLSVCPKCFVKELAERTRSR